MVIHITQPTVSLVSWALAGGPRVCWLGWWGGVGWGGGGFEVTHRGREGLPSSAKIVLNSAKPFPTLPKDCRVFCRPDKAKRC